jgi:archaellum component FlaC
MQSPGFIPLSHQTNEDTVATNTNSKHNPVVAVSAIPGISADASSSNGAGVDHTNGHSPINREMVETLLAALGQNVDLKLQHMQEQFNEITTELNGLAPTEQLQKLANELQVLQRQNEVTDSRFNDLDESIKALSALVQQLSSNTIDLKDENTKKVFKAFAKMTGDAETEAAVAEMFEERAPAGAWNFVKRHAVSAPSLVKLGAAAALIVVSYFAVRFIKNRFFSKKTVEATASTDTVIGKTVPIRPVTSAAGR